MDDRKNFNSDNKGALFARQKTNERGPDIGGEIVLAGDVLNYVVANARSGKVKLELSGWRRSGQKGNFTSISIQIPYKEREGGGQRMEHPQQRPQNSYQNSYRERSQPVQARAEKQPDQPAPWEVNGDDIPF
jgi:hypothetical protein